MQVLFFGLIPVGIFIILKGVNWLLRFFDGKVLLEISYVEMQHSFSIPTPGLYAIWLKGPIFRKTPIDQFRPNIYIQPTQALVPLERSLMGPHASNGSTNRIEIFTFQANKGDYTLALTEGSSATAFESALYKIIPGYPIDLSQFFLQIRERKPLYYVFAGILTIVLGAGCVAGGLIMGLMSDLFK